MQAKVCAATLGWRSTLPCVISLGFQRKKLEVKNQYSGVGFFLFFSKLASASGKLLSRPAPLKKECLKSFRSLPYIGAFVDPVLRALN